MSGRTTPASLVAQWNRLEIKPLAQKHRRFAKGQPLVDERKPGIPPLPLPRLKIKPWTRMGIVASPRLRQQLDERGRGQQFQMPH